MTLHIRGTSTGPIVLGPNSRHLTSIASTGTVIATGIGVDAIDGPPGTAWPIDNDGTIRSAGGLGISLASGGLVSNGSGALISGGIAGILMSGASGTVSNAGAIKGLGVGSTAINTSVISGDGIALLAGGFVSNAAGGSIVASARRVTAMRRARASSSQAVPGRSRMPAGSVDRATAWHWMPAAGLPTPVRSWGVRTASRSRAASGP